MRSTPNSVPRVREWLAAAERGDLPTMKQLVEAEPRLVDAVGRGPYWDGKASALHYAAHRNHRTVVRWLLSRGAPAAPSARRHDWTPLHFAAFAGNRGVVSLLTRHGAVMDIFAAAALGDARTVRRMLREDASRVARRGPDGATPLHFAATPAVARVLLEAGANPDTRDTYHKRTPIEWAVDRPRVAAVIAAARGGVDIHLASASGDLRRVRALISRDPALVNTRVGKEGNTIGAERETPLGIAARYGQRTVVELLLEHGAVATSEPSPLPGAVGTGDRVIVKRLLEAGADPNAFGSHGHAALHVAARNGNLAMIRLLLSFGARLDLEDTQHHSPPVGWAMHFEQKRALALLQPRRAKE